MAGKNRWEGIGNLVDVGQLRQTQSSQSVYSFRIACSEDWFDKQSNERKERTTFINCVLWGKRGEGLSKILDKGSRVMIEGRLETTQWDDKNTGEKRYGFQIVVADIHLMGGGKGKGRSGSTGHDNDRHDEHESAGADAFGDSIPF